MNISLLCISNIVVCANEANEWGMQGRSGEIETTLGMMYVKRRIGYSLPKLIDDVHSMTFDG